MSIYSLFAGNGIYATGQPGFNWSVSDSSSPLLSCTPTVDSTTSAVSGVSPCTAWRHSAAMPVAAGAHSWSVSCTDALATQRHQPPTHSQREATRPCWTRNRRLATQIYPINQRLFLDTITPNSTGPRPTMSIARQPQRHGLLCAHHRQHAYPAKIGIGTFSRPSWFRAERTLEGKHAPWIGQSRYPLPRSSFPLQLGKRDTEAPVIRLMPLGTTNITNPVFTWNVTDSAGHFAWNQHHLQQFADGNSNGPAISQLPGTFSNRFPVCPFSQGTHTYASPAWMRTEHGPWRRAIRNNVWGLGTFLRGYRSPTAFVRGAPAGWTTQPTHIYATARMQ